jgi:hypothetical protein
MLDETLEDSMKLFRGDLIQSGSSADLVAQARARLPHGPERLEKLMVLFGSFPEQAWPRRYWLR